MMTPAKMRMPIEADGEDEEVQREAQGEEQRVWEGRKVVGEDKVQTSTQMWEEM